MCSKLTIYTHHLSDHDIVIYNISVRRVKSAAVNFEYRNIKNIDTVDFEQRLWWSQLFLNSADTPDAYLDQLELAMTSILNDIAPIWGSTRAGGRKAARWLDPDAVGIKQLRRRLERRWKKYDNESDRLAYRAVCRQANESMRPEIVFVVSGTSSMLAKTPSTDADASFCSMLAVFFVKFATSRSPSQHWRVQSLSSDQS